MKFAFISRHAPSIEQIALAGAQSIELVPVGDADAFAITPTDVYAMGIFEGVIVVHPAAAMRLAGKFLIGVFENANRAPSGAPVSFVAKKLHIFK